MTALTVYTIGTLAGGGAGDFTSLQAWEDSIPDDLVVADEVHQGQILNAGDVFSGSTTVLTISGHTTDATRYIELTTATGASFRDNADVQTTALAAAAANGCIISSNGQYSAGQTVIIDQNYCRFSNLQIVNVSLNNRAFHSMGYTGTQYLDINNCICEGTGDGVVWIFGTQQRIRNSLIVQRGSGRGSIIQLDGGAKAVNCTIAAPSDVATKPSYAIHADYSSPVFTNCALFGASAVLTGNASPTYASCMTDVASPPTGCTTATYATSFVDTTNAASDFRPRADSSLLDAAATDATYAATDIAGTSRPQGAAYDVGCWELVVEGGSPSSVAINAQAPEISASAGVTADAPDVLLMVNVALAAPTASVGVSASQSTGDPGKGLWFTDTLPAPTASVAVTVVEVATVSINAIAPDFTVSVGVAAYPEPPEPPPSSAWTVVTPSTTTWTKV